MAASPLGPFGIVFLIGSNERLEKNSVPPSPFHQLASYFLDSIWAGPLSSPGLELLKIFNSNRQPFTAPRYLHIELSHVARLFGFR